MSAGIRFGGDPRRMALEHFKYWLREEAAESRESFVRLYGKPIVRVPVERQVPNEADL